MLIDFEVGNFLSFREPVRLSLLAIPAMKEFLDQNTFEVSEGRLLKSAVVYGANASGKSNLLSALVHMRTLVLNSSKESQADEPIKTTPFKLYAGCENQPSRFEAVFIVEGNRYRYGFEVDARAVRSEWLFRGKGARETALFLREDDGMDVRAGFDEGRGLEEKTRDNALFVSVVAQFNGSLARTILRWFRNVRPLHGLMDMSYVKESIAMLQTPDGHDRLLSFLRQADLGIEDVVAREESFDPADAFRYLSDEGRRRFVEDFGETKLVSLTTAHRKYAEGKEAGQAMLDFDDEESEGTKKLFRMAGAILNCLDNGHIAVIDEIDARLHPCLTLSLLRLFNSTETNRQNSQLVCATHSSALLDRGALRRDQVWFVEKNREGATDLYSLAEFRLATGHKVRKDAAFEKNYIEGRYGAIPYIGNLEELFWERENGKAGQDKRP